MRMCHVRSYIPSSGLEATLELQHNIVCTQIQYMYSTAHEQLKFRVRGTHDGLEDPSRMTYK